MKEYLKREHAKPALKFLARVLMVDLGILVLTTVGLLLFSFLRSQLNLASFVQSLTILLLLEGSLIGAAGAFLFYGYSEYKAAGQGATNPAIARDQVDKWKERRFSQQKWGVALLLAGLLLIFMGLLVSFLTSF